MSTDDVLEHGTPPEQPNNAASEEEDDFGGFDDFGEFESGEEADLTEAVEATTLDGEPGNGVDLSTEEASYKVEVVESSKIGAGVEDKIRNLLTPPPESTETYEGDGCTPTSQQLWHVLTEPSWVPVPDWNGSRIHKRLAVSLGVPLNLDESLPKVATRRMVLPTTSEESIEGMQRVPEWSLLSVVSHEALESMTADELHAHTATLAAAISSAETLKDAVESQEMDLLGEKNILEGMVESLLAYSQRNQRESLMRKASKSKR